MSQSCTDNETKVVAIHSQRHTSFFSQIDHIFHFFDSNFSDDFLRCHFDKYIHKQNLGTSWNFIFGEYKWFPTKLIYVV